MITIKLINTIFAGICLISILIESIYFPLESTFFKFYYLNNEIPLLLYIYIYTYLNLIFLFIILLLQQLYDAIFLKIINVILLFLNVPILFFLKKCYYLFFSTTNNLVSFLDFKIIKVLNSYDVINFISVRMKVLDVQLKNKLTIEDYDYISSSAQDENGNIIYNKLIEIIDMYLISLQKEELIDLQKDLIHVFGYVFSKTDLNSWILSVTVSVGISICSLFLMNTISSFMKKESSTNTMESNTIKSTGSEKKKITDVFHNYDNMGQRVSTSISTGTQASTDREIIVDGPLIIDRLDKLDLALFQFTQTFNKTVSSMYDLEQQITFDLQYSKENVDLFTERQSKMWDTMMDVKDTTNVSYDLLKKMIL